ncbi:methyltransferase family protein [Methylomicrobium lacus]|uniref:methyltransferase family protein n=1 Tax=Methylomicrobium lacus TaxID=136992 RepID=UPI0018E06F46|nr:isoprenylcysteine carboxylmethyltransferase family protein [Methylomicrobium lacus]
MMIQIGNFFFKYRNWVFIPLYLALFIPSPELVTIEHHNWVMWTGLFITILGQGVRCATIGLAYIERGGKDKKVYASNLVTEGVFDHCRNPLYVGNILKLIGIGILANSLLYIAVFIPAFLFIYQSIVLAEENFLRSKFGKEFDAYCQRANRWIPRFSGLFSTFNSMNFRWQRPVVKENSSVYVWLIGIVLVLLYKYPELTSHEVQLRNQLLMGILSILTVIYLGIRYLKKSGKLQGL